MRNSSSEKTLKARGLKRLYVEENGNAKRTALLIILLLVLAAAAVFLLYPDLFAPAPEPAKKAPPQVKRKVVQLPQKAEQKAPAKKAAQQEAAPKVAEKAAEKKEPAEKAEAAKVDKQAVAKPAPEVKKTAAKAEEQKAAQQQAEAQKAAQQAAVRKAEPKVSIAGPKGPYTVTGGAYLLAESVANADKIVRQLGYAPYHSKVTRDIEVIRLKEGTYPEPEARARLTQYKRDFSSEAFMLKTSGGWTVYLGSYVGLDRARVYADRLYAQGLRVSEEKAMVPMELTLVRFGDFQDEASAAQVVAKAKAAGLGAYVSKVK